APRRRASRRQRHDGHGRAALLRPAHAGVGAQPRAHDGARGGGEPRTRRGARGRRGRAAGDLRVGRLRQRTERARAAGTHAGPRRRSALMARRLRPAHRGPGRPRPGPRLSRLGAPARPRAPSPAWERAGAMGASGANALLTRYRALASKRILILGSGQLALTTAALALEHGIEVAGVVEVGDALRAEIGSVPALHGVPIYLSHT